MHSAEHGVFAHLRGKAAVSCYGDWLDGRVYPSAEERRRSLSWSGSSMARVLLRDHGLAIMPSASGPPGSAPTNGRSPSLDSRRLPIWQYAQMAGRQLRSRAGAAVGLAVP